VSGEGGLRHRADGDRGQGSILTTQTGDVDSNTLGSAGKPPCLALRESTRRP
jgi:hypothetical protein